MCAICEPPCLLKCLWWLGRNGLDGWSVCYCLGCFLLYVALEEGEGKGETGVEESKLS